MSRWRRFRRNDNSQKTKFGVRTDEIGKSERTVEGILCDSKGEAKRYAELLWLEKLGKIRDLRAHQDKFRLEVNGHLITTYRPDFKYFDCDLGKMVIEDFKGYQTRDFKIRWALMKALYETSYVFILSNCDGKTRRVRGKRK